jgi:broad specificity phosphatase PhoE
MKVILFRHAEKQSGFGEDLTLSSLGTKQAFALKDLIESGKFPKPDVMYTSPKKRSLETFEPLARAISLPIQKDPNLDEQGKSENVIVFRSRIHQFIDNIESDSKQTIFICTHLDWIEQFATLLSCDTDLHALVNFTWNPAAYMIFDVQDIWHLIDKGQIK